MVQACDNLKPGAMKNINTTRTTMTSDMVLRYFYMADIHHSLYLSSVSTQANFTLCRNCNLGQRNWWKTLSRKSRKKGNSLTGGLEPTPSTATLEKVYAV